MTGKAPQKDETVDVFVSYDDSESVAELRASMASERPPNLLAPTFEQAAAAAFAGVISIRYLANGVIDWARKVKGVTVVCQYDPEERIWHVSPDVRQNVSRVIVLHPDGPSQVFDLPDSRSHEVEAAFEAVLRHYSGGGM